MLQGNPSAMLRKLLAIFVACVWTSILFLLCCLAMLVTFNASSTIWICRKLWSPVLVATGGGRLEVTGQENVDPKRPTIYVSNHQSTIDIPALFMAIPVDLRFVTKKELSYVPVLGWYLRLAKYIFIDRGNRAKAIRSLEIAAQRIREESLSLIVYPEGTRSEDGRILPFKKGPFALALKAGVPVCPVTVEGSGKLMPKRSWNITPGPIRVKIGEPIDPRAFHPDDREGLARAVRSVIIRQSLELGGLGGDPDNAIAATETSPGESPPEAVRSPRAGRAV